MLPSSQEWMLVGEHAFLGRVVACKDNLSKHVLLYKRNNFNRDKSTTFFFCLRDDKRKTILDSTPQLLYSHATKPFSEINIGFFSSKMMSKLKINK